MTCTCTEVRQDLVAYCLGAVSTEQRDRIDDHLPACPACVRELCQLKRAIETGEDGEAAGAAAPRPSPAARERLRRAVADQLAAAPTRRAAAAPAPPPARRWWERPIALTFAGSAVLCAFIAMRALTSGPGRPPVHPAPAAATR